MDSFLKQYHGHIFVDDGIYCSEDFKSFSRKFKNYLKRNLPKDCLIKKHRCNHYCFSGFVERSGKYIYYSYSWNRYSPVDIKVAGVLNGGILYRKADNDSDYTGGINNFCSIEDLPERISKML